MKNTVIAFLMLIFLVSCSSLENEVIRKDSTLDEGSQSSQASGPTTPKVTKDIQIADSVKDAKEAPDVAIPDKKNDIASLLEPDNIKKFDLPVVFNDNVKYFIDSFTTEKRTIFGSWLKRSHRYVPAIKRILKDHGLPEELVYLAMIESGFNPNAYSPAKACGPWQFIHETGGRYGLKVNFWIDERRDFGKSTVAAAKYLRKLYDQFGNWYLAAAGYNAGENRVESAIGRYNTKDFWELAKHDALPRETREYVPKLIAAAIIAKYPERFGFGDIKYEVPLRFVEIKVPRSTPLSIVAKVSRIDLDKLRSLNPEILLGITPPDTENYKIKLPASVNARKFLKQIEVALRNKKL